MRELSRDRETAFANRSILHDQLPYAYVQCELLNVRRANHVTEEHDPRGVTKLTSAILLAYKAAQHKGNCCNHCYRQKRPVSYFLIIVIINLDMQSVNGGTSGDLNNLQVPKAAGSEQGLYSMLAGLLAIMSPPDCTGVRPPPEVRQRFTHPHLDAVSTSDRNNLRPYLVHAGLSLFAPALAEPGWQQLSPTPLPLRNNEASMKLSMLMTKPLTIHHVNMNAPTLMNA